MPLDARQGIGVPGELVCCQREVHYGERGDDRGFRCVGYFLPSEASRNPLAADAAISSSVQRLLGRRLAIWLELPELMASAWEEERRTGRSACATGSES